LAAGTRSLNLTNRTAGSWTLTATNITDGTKASSTSPPITVNAGAFVKMQLLVPGESAAPGTSTGKTGTPSAQTAGAPFSVTVNAVDANWNVVSTVSHIVGITSSDANATLPSNTPLSSGTQTLSVTLNTAGNRTLTATNITDGTKTSSVSPSITVNAGAFVKLQLLVPGETAAPGTTAGKTGTPNAQTAGTAFNITINAVDANWNLINTVTHTVGISSTDTNATFPATTNLAAGTRVVSVTFKTAGSQTLTASDITDGTKTPNTSPAITVNPGALVKLQLLLPGEIAAPGSATGKTGTPSAQIAGTTITNGIIVNAVDANWNLVSSATNNVTITSTDTNAVIANDNGAAAGNITLAAGTKTLSTFTFKTAGARTVTAIDASGSLTANTSPTVTVTAGAVTKLQILVPGESAAPGSATGKSGTPSSQTTLTPILNGVIVNAVDANWNVVNTATTNVTITSSDTSAIIADDNAATAGNMTMAAGTATLSSFSFVNSGVQTITATDGILTANTSGNITVNALATTTVVTSAQNPSVFGQPVVFTATVSASTGTASGTATFRDGINVLGTQPLDGSGQAKLTNSTFAVGSHSITATYNGNSTHASSTSSVLTQTVNAASTTTTLASSLNPSCSNSTFTLTATIAVVPPGSGSPAGSVVFKDGVTSLATNSVSFGQATFTSATFAPGSHSMTAVFSDGTSLAGSTSLVLTQVVNARPTGGRQRQHQYLSG
jgi:hypothetical protein